MIVQWHIGDSDLERVDVINDLGVLVDSLLMKADASCWGWQF
jgi:hypothetical protein